MLCQAATHGRTQLHAVAERLSISFGDNNWVCSPVSETCRSSHWQTRRLDRFDTDRTELTEKIQTGVFIKWTRYITQNHLKKACSHHIKTVDSGCIRTVDSGPKCAHSSPGTLDGNRRTCFSPSRMVTFLPVHKSFVPAGPKCEVFQEGCDKKRHKLRNFCSCARASHSSQKRETGSWGSWGEIAEA